MSIARDRKACMAMARAVASELSERGPDRPQWLVVGLEGAHAHIGTCKDRKATVLKMGTDWWTWYPEGWPYHEGRTIKAYARLDYQTARKAASLWLTRAMEPQA